jgi:hypothetical protein
LLVDAPEMGVRTVVVLLLAGVCAWLLVRGLIRHAVPWWALAVLIVPLLVLGYGERQWLSAEQEFSSVARRIAPDAAGVHCQRRSETFFDAGAGVGRVWFGPDGTPERAALLSYETCQRLAAWWRSDPVDRGSAPLDEIVALHTLTHESIHLTGERSEALTECRAMQLDEQVALTLGASPAAARQVAVRYAAEVFPRIGADYRSADCRPDGPLDLTPGDDSWP